MTPSLGAYIGGAFGLIGIAAALGLGGFWLRQWIVPEFTGALARLSEITIAVSLMIVALEFLGTVGIFRLGWVIVGCIAVGLLAALVGWKRAPRGVEGVAAPRVGLWALIIAIAVASFTVAEWSFPSLLSMDQGMFGGDTTWYHMPFSARFVQDASITSLHFTDPLRLVVWFYPQTSELINGAVMAVMQSDWLSPVINMGWLAFAMLAAWCIGRPYRVSPATLVAAAIVLDGGIMIETQAGEARNDIMALAFLLAFAAFLINGHQRHAPTSGAVSDAPDPNAPLLDKGPLALAGLAGGIAISVKLTMLAPVGAIALGVILFSGRGRRWTSTWVLAISMAVTGGYWYVRSAIASGGNPAPQLKFGPLNLPTPDQMPLDPRPRFSVTHYLLEPPIYRKWFFPELHNAIGPFWPLILISAIAATVYIIFKSSNKIVRVLAAGALLAAVVYLFTPLTAAGPEGQPRGFFTNTRYLMPGVVLGMVLLPITRPLRMPEGRAWKTLIFLTVVYWISVLTTPHWYPAYIGGVLLLVAALIWVPVSLGYLHGLRRISRRKVLAGAGVMVLLLVLVGRQQQVDFSEHAYTRNTLFLQDGGPVAAFDYMRDKHDQHVGIAGSGEIFFSQYGFYGADRSNRVDFIGVPGKIGAYRLATTCEQFRNRINAGNYDYVVVSRFTQDSPQADFNYPIRAWIMSDPALEEVVAEPDITPQPDYVYKVNGKLDPAGCRTLGKNKAKDA